MALPEADPVYFLPDNQADEDYPDGFRALDEIYARHPLSPRYQKLFKRLQLTHTEVLDTPPEVKAVGLIQTNSSTLEIIPSGPDKGEFLGYVRTEPPVDHIGLTESVPHLVKRDGRGGHYLQRYLGAQIVRGEDPRIFMDIPYLDSAGRPQVGVCVSTVVATPVSERDRSNALHIRQEFWCGQWFDNLELVGTIEGHKNACLASITLPDPSGFGTIVKFDGVGRPRPYMSYLGRFKFVNELSARDVENGIIINEDFVADGTHTGPNAIRRKPGYPNILEIDMHEACAPEDEHGLKDLNYRLGIDGYGLPIAGLPAGEYIPGGNRVGRDAWGSSRVKEPQHDVRNFKKIAYGAFGNIGRTMVGLSDNALGYATWQKV